MNKHTQMALFVAPFLAVIGWIASDIWVESQALKKQLFTLKAEAGYCDVMAKKCILHANDLKISVYEEQGRTVLNSTLPLDTATFFLVDKSQGSATETNQQFQMGMKDSPYYWYQNTGFAAKNSEQGSKQTFRIIVAIKGAKYIGEFVSTTLGTDIAK